MTGPTFNRFFLPVLLVAALAFGVAACGGGDDGSDSAGATLEDPVPGASYCPMNEDGSIPADALNTQDLVGEKLADAEKVAADHDCEVRVTWQDGVGVPSTMDYRPNRINVFVEGKTVTEIDSVG